MERSQTATAGAYSAVTQLAIAMFERRAQSTEAKAAPADAGGQVREGLDLAGDVVVLQPALLGPQHAGRADPAAERRAGPRAADRASELVCIE